MADKRKKLVVANWKMHLNLTQAATLVHRLDKAISERRRTEVVLCPPFTALQPLVREVSTGKFTLGAQNLHYQDEGAFTGEVSGPMLKDLARYVIVGHSERRRWFNESDDVVARKLAAALRNGLVPILCVGETLIERQDQHTNLVVHDQLVAALAMLTAEDVAGMVVAYEPIWAVGSGEIAKPEQIKAAIATIRKTISELYGKTAAEKVRVLYGGSVAAEFVSAYMQLKGLDGFLVGGASLNWQQFAEIVAGVQSAA